MVIHAALCKHGPNKEYKNACLGCSGLAHRSFGRVSACYAAACVA